MLKALIIVATLSCATFAVSAAPPRDDVNRLVDFGKFKAVVIAGTTSEDGRYALAWAITPAKKGVKPVDWSLWSADPDKDELLEHYHMDDSPVQTGDYKVDYFAVDLRSKKAVAVPADVEAIHGWAYGDDADHSDSFHVVWSGAVGGKRYGLIQFDYFNFIDADNLFLVAAGPAQMQEIDLSGVDDAVDALLPKARDGYTTRYTVGEDDGGRPLPVFHGAYADVYYIASIPHNADSDLVLGRITLRLADGKVMGLTNTGGDEEAAAIQDNPELKKADAELNNVYQALEKELTPAARAALGKEQRAWVKKRNEAIDAAGEAGGRASDGADETRIRDKTQLDLTRKRAAELKARLAALH